MNARSSDIHFIHFIQNIFERKRICDVTDVRNDIFSCVSIFVAPLNLSLFCCKKRSRRRLSKLEKKLQSEKKLKSESKVKVFLSEQEFDGSGRRRLQLFRFSSFSAFAVETKWASPKKLGLGHISLNILLI